MLETIKHQDVGPLVVVAKELTGYLKIKEKVTDPDSYVKVNGTFDAEYVAYVVSWQGNHGVTADGVIGPDTWTAISKAAPTCSTSKNRISGFTMALQLLLGGNLTADAIYGSRTKSAVAVYQDSKNLVADGICGPKTWNALIVGSEPAPTPTPGKFTQPVDYKQASKPWGPKMYSNHNDKSQTMANSGCGPTAMADIVATLIDKTATPWTLAQLAMEWGDRTYNSGTAWSFFPHVADYYHFDKMVQSKSLDALKKCLDSGGYVVCSMGPGYWTKGGHFICAWKYDGAYIYCNDPASSTRKKQKISAFMNERKQFFCFYPVPLEPEPDNTPTDEPVKRGDKICDVAKYQGKIDWNKLAPELAFVIIKASGLYANGADPYYVRNVTEAVKRGVPFHAYSFLYCKTEAEARRDAGLFYDTVKAGGHDPLFWVLDCEAEWGVRDKDAPRIAQAFEDELRRLAGEDIRVAIYVANQKYDDWAFDYSWFAYVWIPYYKKKPPSHPCDLWQYTSRGRLPGISGNVDLDVIISTRHDLDWFCGR